MCVCVCVCVRACVCVVVKAARTGLLAHPWPALRVSHRPHSVSPQETAGQPCAWPRRPGGRFSSCPRSSPRPRLVLPPPPPSRSVARVWHEDGVPCASHTRLALRAGSHCSLSLPQSASPQGSAGQPGAWPRRPGGRFSFPSCPLSLSLPLSPSSSPPRRHAPRREAARTAPASGLSLAANGLRTPLSLGLAH